MQGKSQAATRKKPLPGMEPAPERAQVVPLRTVGTRLGGEPPRPAPGRPSGNVCPYCGGPASDTLTSDPADGGPPTKSVVCQRCGPLTIIDLDPDELPSPAMPSPEHSPERFTDESRRFLSKPPPRIVTATVMLVFTASALTATLRLSSGRLSIEERSRIAESDATHESRNRRMLALVSHDPAPMAPAAFMPRPEPPPPPAQSVPAVVPAAPAITVASAVPAKEPPPRPQPAAPPKGEIPAWIPDGSLRRLQAPPRRIAVEREPMQAEAQPVEAASTSPVWQSLAEGMTKAQVVALLGPPRWREQSLVAEFWMYETKSILASGVIVFEADRVASWRVP